MSEPQMESVPRTTTDTVSTAVKSPSWDDLPAGPRLTTPTAPAATRPLASTYEAVTNHNAKDAEPDDEHFIDDGHIHVCVRIRDVPSHPAHTPKGASAGAGGPRKSVGVKEANKICVSALDNIIVMHDPKSLDDTAALARDTNNVVQILTDRANAQGGGGGARGARARASSGKTRTRSSQRCSTFTRGLTSTATASYYECDHTITSMDESAALRMPLIRTSDFLQPPPYGSQESVYRATAQHAVKAAVEGINSCVFAYGQTGSGKTYTLFGDTHNVRADPGVVPRTLDDLFERLQDIKAAQSSNPEVDYSYTVAFSFFEIYQNDVYCLLSRQGPLHVQYSRDTQGKKETMVIHELQQQTLASAEKAYPLIELGLRRRQTGETGMNARSSRSHAIFQVRLTQFTTNRETRETVELHSTINLVDLAGSERQKTAKTEGKNREEGIQINQSLATLARVINDIASGAKFINYRDSLLTMVLKDNLGGNSKTFMIATVSPVAFSYQESCSTLTYAKAVRKIRNRPTVNRTFQTRANLVEQNARLKAENEKLKDQMELWMKRVQQQQQQQSFVEDSGCAGEGTPNLLDGISPIRGGGQQVLNDLSGFLRHVDGSPMGPTAGNRGVLKRIATGHDGIVRTEALVAATSAGLTTPLLVASHRRYTSVAGIGMACVEGGVARVTSLVAERTTFALTLNSHDTQPPPQHAACPETAGRATDASDAIPSVSISPEVTALNVASTACVTDAGEEEEAQARHRRDHSVSISPTPQPTTGELGYVEVERVCQRSCEQRFWVRYVAPAHGADLDTVLTVQLNGKDLGASRREMHHGDVVCAYVDDPNQSEEQHLLTYHFVDLNCLSRTSASTNRATLGQLAISVDLPEEVENLTLENIQQLQRDNAKLLDMVRQQAQTVDYHTQKEASRARMESVTRLSSALGSRSISPNPRTLQDVSGVAADADEEELLRRAREAGLSQERLDSVMRENAELHKKAVRRNAALDALAEQLAALEAGGDVDGLGPRRSSASSSSRSSTEGRDSSEEQTAFEEEAQRVTVSVSPSMARGVSLNANDLSGAPTSISQFPRSMTRVSSPSSSSSSETDDDDEVDRADAAGQSVVQGQSPLPLRAADAEAPNSNIKIFYENTDGTRERYNAALRQREQYNKIVELEAIIDDLRMQLAMLESRLRVAKDDTMEEELARQAVEAERDALFRQLQEVQAENAELTRDNTTLETICHQNEDALHQATAMNEEEIERRLAILAAKNKALHELARLWKRRTMKYIAMGYGAGDDLSAGEEASGQHARLEEIPWDVIRFGATADIVKRRLVGAAAVDMADASDEGQTGDTAMLKGVDEFEQATALEALVALEAALKDFESENRRLQDEVRRYEDMLRDLKDLIARLRRERDELEKEATSASANEEESRRLKALLDAKMAQLESAEANLEQTQQNLSSAIEQTEANKRRARKNNEMLLAEQKKTIEQLENHADLLQTNLNGKDEELRNLLRYMEENELVGADGAVQDYQLRNRIEDLIADAMKSYDAPNGYSAFPTDFEFSEEMIALIRVCLRILLDRLKVELYVLNRQNLHKLSLLMPTVQLRPDAQFHSFMHELRGVVVEMGGRAQRIGGRWSISEADVLADLVDHRRRRASGALYGLLVWYDHWDVSPKLEHVCYMELIRNADRVLQIARQVRQQDALNTNATSTLMMPIPGKKGCSDAVPLGEDSKKSDQTTIQQSCDALNKINASMKRSNLAKFCNSPSKMAMPVEDDYELNSNTGSDDLDDPSANRKLFRRTATALVMSQTTLPFSRTGTATTSALLPDTSPTKHTASATAARRASDCPMPLGRWASATTHLSGVGAEPARQSPQKSAAAAPGGGGPLSRRGSTAGMSPSAFGRVASTAAMPVSDTDVTYVASSEVAFVDSINTYNYNARRASLQTGPGDMSSGTADTFERKRTSRALPFSRNASAVGGCGAVRPSKRQSTGGVTFNRSATAVVMPVSAPSSSSASTKKQTAVKPARSTVQDATTPSEAAPRRSGSKGGRASSSSGSAHGKKTKKLVRSQTAIPSAPSHDATTARPSRHSPSALPRGSEQQPDGPQKRVTGTTNGGAARGLPAPRVAGGGLFGRTKSSMTGPLSRTGAATRLSASHNNAPNKLMRSQTTTSGVLSEKAPRRSSSGGPTASKKGKKLDKLVVTEVADDVHGDITARSMSTIASPKPRTPLRTTSKSGAQTTGGKDVDVTTLVGRTSTGGPTPGFYNPNVLNALRERSTSESNQANASGDHKGEKTPTNGSAGAAGKAKKNKKRTSAAQKVAAQGKHQ